MITNIVRNPQLLAFLQQISGQKTFKIQYTLAHLNIPESLADP